MTQCMGIAQFVAIYPEFKNTGEKAAGAITLDAQPAPGDTITITPIYGNLPVPEVLTAGTSYQIGATIDDTAANLAAALGQLVTGAASGAVVYVESTSAGVAGQHVITASGPFTITQLAGGDLVVQSALDCACAQLSPECYGSKLECAHGYLTAHLLALAAMDGGGPVSGRKIDKLEVRYSTGSGQFDATRYGRMFELIKKSVVVLPVAGRYSAITFGC